jgi:Photosynthesis affected mutant 68
MPADESRQSLPFEPVKNKQRKAAKKGTPIINPPTPSPSSPERGSGYVPEVVSQRMIRRVGVFSGIPIILGISIFLGSYLVISNHWFKIPNVVVLLTSMGCLGLSVLGLSYGILSACWEEDSSIKGSLLGWQECKTNFGRMAQAYRASQRMRPRSSDN